MLRGVVLRGAGGEVAGHADARRFGGVGVVAEVVLADDGDLVEQHGGKRRVDVQLQVVFVVLVVESRRGHGLAADALVLAGPVLVAVLGIGGVAFAELVRGAKAELGVARGRGHVGLVECRRDSAAVGARCALTTAFTILFRAIERARKLLLGAKKMGPVALPS